MIDNSESQAKSVLEIQLEYSLTDKNGSTETKPASAQITAESLLLRPDLGEPIQLSWREIERIFEADYRIGLDLPAKTRIWLFNLGYQYEDFLRLATKFHNEMLLQDLLMVEAVKKSGIVAEFSYSDKNGKITFQGEAELRLYETALIIIPVKGDFIRVPYGNLAEVKVENYQMIIMTAEGEKIILAKLGDQLDPFQKMMSEIINDLALTVQSFFKEILPQADTLLIRRAAQLMKEGRAVNINILKSLSSQLSPALEDKMADFGMREEYDYLCSLADREKIALGFKRGLMGDLTGDYLWFLIPIYSINTKQPGNAIALETSAAHGGGRSTYFFRIFPRKKYQTISDIEALRQGADDLIKIINRAMMEINFRREPIYLSEEKLNEPEYLKYKLAVEKLPALRTLRSLFIGRVAHSSLAQWQIDVNNLLKFNVSETNDDQKWLKSEETVE
jgi:hypothetical protein